MVGLESSQSSNRRKISIEFVGNSNAIFCIAQCLGSVISRHATIYNFPNSISVSLVVKDLFSHIYFLSEGQSGFNNIWKLSCNSLDILVFLNKSIKM